MTLKQKITYKIEKLLEIPLTAQEVVKTDSVGVVSIPWLVRSAAPVVGGEGELFSSR